MKIENMKLGDIVEHFPESTRVFRNYGLDFCCGGSKSLTEACREKSLAVETIMKDIKTLRHAPAPHRDMNLADLTRHIITRYHEDLRQRLPELIVLAQKVEKQHPDAPKELLPFLNHFYWEMIIHMQKEENGLFPLLVSNRQVEGSRMAITQMLLEHDRHGESLLKLRDITNNFTPPEHACPTWKVLYAGLDRLEQELREHIYLENHILFHEALEPNPKLA